MRFLSVQSSYGYRTNPLPMCTAKRRAAHIGGAADVAKGTGSQCSHRHMRQTYFLKDEIALAGSLVLLIPMGDDDHLQLSGSSACLPYMKKVY